MSFLTLSLSPVLSANLFTQILLSGGTFSPLASSWMYFTVSEDLSSASWAWLRCVLSLCVCVCVRTHARRGCGVCVCAYEQCICVSAFLVLPFQLDKTRILFCSGSDFQIKLIESSTITNQNNFRAFLANGINLLQKQQYFPNEEVCVSFSPMSLGLCLSHYVSFIIVKGKCLDSRILPLPSSLLCYLLVRYEILTHNFKMFQFCFLGQVDT